MICDLFATDGSDTHGKADQRPRRQRMDRAEIGLRERADQERRACRQCHSGDPGPAECPVQFEPFGREH